MLRDSGVVAAVVVRTRPRLMLLAMTTMRKSTHGFFFLSYMSMKLRRGAKRSSILLKRLVNSLLYILTLISSGIIHRNRRCSLATLETLSEQRWHNFLLFSFFHYSAFCNLFLVDEMARTLYLNESQSNLP